MKKIVGKVTDTERDEIRAIFERRKGLAELAKILTADNSELYERLVKDLADTSTKFQSWWNFMESKYKWESVENGNWTIDFQSCIIYLECPE